MTGLVNYLAVHQFPGLAVPVFQHRRLGLRRRPAAGAHTADVSHGCAHDGQRDRWRALPGLQQQCRERRDGPLGPPRGLVPRRLGVIGEWGSGFQTYALDQHPRTRTRSLSSLLRPGQLPADRRDAEQHRRRQAQESGHVQHPAVGCGAWEPFFRYEYFDLSNKVFTAGLADPNLWANRVFQTGRRQLAPHAVRQDILRLEPRRIQPASLLRTRQAPVDRATCCRCGCRSSSDPHWGLFPAPAIRKGCIGFSKTRPPPSSSGARRLSPGHPWSRGPHLAPF